MTVHTGIDLETANVRFLSASLDWLRLLLRRQAEQYRPPGVPSPQPVAPQPVAATPQPPAQLFGRVDRPSTTDTVPPQPAPTSTQPRRPRQPPVTDEQIARAALAVREAESAAPQLLPLADLALRLGLSRFERDTLMLCVATELDPSIGRLCALAQGARTADRLAYPTFALALAVLPDPAWEVVSPQRGLRYWRLVEIVQHGGQGLVGATLRADERIVNHIKGMDYLDDRLSPLVEQLPPVAAAQLPPSQQDVVDEIARHWDRPDQVVPVVQLVGPDGPGKQLVAARSAEVAGVVACRLNASSLPTQPGELDNLARLWLREATLLPLALYLEVDDAETPEQPRPISRFLSRLQGKVLLAARESRSDLGRSSLALDVEPPTPAERARAWRTSFGEDVHADDIDALAAQFSLELPAIQEIAAVAGGDPRHAWRACQIRTRPRLDALAQRVSTRVTWDDIELPEPGRQVLAQLADQVAHRTTVYEAWGFGERVTRGLGLSALFAGPSGVGKTMAAEVLANHLRLDLYRIDLSAVVSKYIGETEKNLRQLFDAAEGGGAILFFDECDSLFGKRSEVKDAHDRYANIEINYLLQRMEAYRGLAILATNMKSALDTAFLRRLRFIIEFQFPGAAQRRAIWEKSFPATAPRGDIDFDRLSRLQVSGGMIRNIALNAAFLAVSAGTPIGMAQVLTAARTEFAKLELPVPERDFVWNGASA